MAVHKVGYGAHIRCEMELYRDVFYPIQSFAAGETLLYFCSFYLGCQISLKKAQLSLPKSLLYFYFGVVL